MMGNHKDRTSAKGDASVSSPLNKPVFGVLLLLIGFAEGDASVPSPLNSTPAPTELY